MILAKLTIHLEGNVKINFGKKLKCKKKKSSKNIYTMTYIT